MVFVNDVPVFNTGNNLFENVLLVPALAESKPLVDYINKNYQLLKRFNFSDHHYFSRKDLRRIITDFKTYQEVGIAILFTEKDIMRLEGSELKDILMEYPVFFQPITYKFAHNGSEFDELIQKVIVNTED